MVTDQADGLRRLMARKAGKRVAVLSLEPDPQACGFTLNLAAALRQQGQEVLLLDEQGSAQPLPVHTEAQLVLIKAGVDQDGALSPLAARADHILLVFQAKAAAIKEAYLCIKRLHYAHALQHVHVLVNEAEDTAEARRILANLATTASRYLAVALEPAGWVRADPFLLQARRLNLSVVDAFQASPAARDFRHIASELLQWPCRPASGNPIPSTQPGLGLRNPDQSMAPMR